MEYLQQEHRTRLNDIFSTMQDNIQRVDISQYLLFVDAMDSISGHLSSGTKYFASCIKIFSDNKEEPRQIFVRTFCRDSKSKRTRGWQDGDEVFNVDNNTAFYTILRKGDHSFCSNDLLADPHYQNEREGFERYYRSTVVVPIAGSLPLQGQDVTSSIEALMGFLCVDSRDVNAFDCVQTVNFLSWVADAIFLPLYHFASPSHHLTYNPQNPLEDKTINNG